MKPEQLICWCATYRIELSRDEHSVTAIAYDDERRPITRVKIDMPNETGKKLSSDIGRALAVCDAIAEELCILKPSIVNELNLASSRPSEPAPGSD